MTSAHLSGPAHAARARAAPQRIVRRAAFALALSLVCVVGAPGLGARASGDRGTLAPAARADASDTARGWRWPVSPVRIAAPFRAPPHAYGAGHRGIDLTAPPGAEAASPAAGVVAFAGTVAERGIVTIDHGGGLATTLEPVTPAVAVGAAVLAGEGIGRVDAGGHAPVGTLHVGVRQDGVYINPLLLLGDVPAAILLPCC